MSLCKCISEVVDMLLPKQQICQVIKRLLEDEKPTCLSLAKSVVEYWLWGPVDVTLNNERQPALQRLVLFEGNYISCCIMFENFVFNASNFPFQVVRSRKGYFPA